MRVMRGQTFEGPNGVWEKIEVELDSNDLLPDEKAAADQVKLQLLEIRADKHLLLFMSRSNRIDSQEAKSKLAELDMYKKKLLEIKAKPILRPRGLVTDATS